MWPGRAVRSHQGKEGGGVGPAAPALPALPQAKPSRLHCSHCDETYSLPQNGTIKLYKELRCPLDDFELVLWSSGSRGKSYPLCPYCYNHPPFRDMKKGEWQPAPLGRALAPAPAQPQPATLRGPHPEDRVDPGPARATPAGTH